MGWFKTLQIGTIFSSIVFGAADIKTIFLLQKTSSSEPADYWTMETISNVPLWTPHDVDKTNTAQFIQWANRRRGLQLQTYLELQEWSTGPATYLDFWEDAYDFLQIGREQSPPRQRGKKSSSVAVSTLQDFCMTKVLMYFCDSSNDRSSLHSNSSRPRS